MKVVLCGPSRSGKSCLREGLKQAIRRVPGAPYPYVITAAPDGEGAWFQETVDRSPKEARELKTAYKQSLNGFFLEFVKRVADSVANCELPLTLVDIGGVPSAENKEICRHATHAILLTGDVVKFAKWRDFCVELGLRVVAEIHSDYHGQEDTVPVLGEDGVCRGSVHCLERGEPVHERPTVRALAEILAKMANSQE